MTAVAGLITAVADKGSFFHPGAVFQNEPIAGLITEMAVSAEVVTDDELTADVGSFAGKAFGTEVVRIIERSYVPGIKGTMELHFFGDGGGILAKILCDILKGCSLIQRLFDVLSVIES